MDYVTLVQSGPRVSRMGFGCGGHSRLGLARGGSSDNTEHIAKDALSLGINFIDTAETYGTEATAGTRSEPPPLPQYVQTLQPLDLIKGQWQY
jgi:aryl-alcohol dehydrogenase-like predicted oxidoreductase